MDRPQDPGKHPSVAVVIPCRDEAATVIGLLDAIEQQDLWPREIIVVNDGSTDGTAALALAWSRTRPGLALTVLQGPGRGPAAAMNVGIRHAKSDIIVRLDGHCRPRAGYLTRSVRTLVDEGAGVVGGVWEIEPGAASRVARAIAAVVAHPIGSGGAAYRDASRTAGPLESVDTVPFGCFRRALWERVGGYDEHLISNEDYDFNYRVIQDGHAVLLNREIRSMYGARSTLRALGRQYFRYGFWKTQMLRKSPGALQLRQVPPALVLPWVCATTLLALTVGGFIGYIAAALYPALVAAVVMRIAAARGELGLLVPVFAAIVIQHGAWSAGFWHGMLYPSPNSA